MDTDQPSQEDATSKVPAQPKSTTASLILNGAGNGMMVGAIPFAVLNLYGKLTHKKMPDKMEAGSIFAAIAGCAIGSVYGIKEAKELRLYRAALGRELSELRAQAEANKAAIAGWTEKHQAAQTDATDMLTR